MRAAVLLAVLAVVVAAALVAPSGLGARPVADRAVQAVLQASDPDVSSLEILHRAPVTPELDLVLALGGHGGWRPGMTPIPRGPQRMGTFLQERARPERVYTIAIDPAYCGDGGALQRATATDLVLTCANEKPSTDYDASYKLVYDVRAKALVGRVSYQPFHVKSLHATATAAGAGAVPGAGSDGGTDGGTVGGTGGGLGGGSGGSPGPGAVLVAFDERRLVAVEFRPDRDPMLRVMTESEALPWTRRVKVVESWVGIQRTPWWYVEPPAFRAFPFGPDRRYWLTEILDTDDPEDGHLLIQEDLGARWKRHRLPRSTREQYAAARPEELENIGPDYELDESIGPHQLVGDVLWFGKSFYDSEGMTGVGGFGTFDATTGEYRVISPKEMLDWSVEALHVTDDAVWMTLDFNGEWGEHGGGLLRYDRGSGAVRTHPLPAVGRHVLRVGDHVVVGTDLGISIVHGDAIRHFFVDVTTDGRLRIAEGIRLEDDAGLRR